MDGCECNRFDSAVVIVGWGIIFDRRSTEHFYNNGSVTGQRYSNDNLKPYVKKPLLEVLKYLT